MVGGGGGGGTIRKNVRSCLHEPYMEGWRYLASSRALFEILIKNCLCLHEKGASPPRRNLAIVYVPEISPDRAGNFQLINATEGTGPPSSMVNKPPYDARIRFKLN